MGLASAEKNTRRPREVCLTFEDFLSSLRLLCQHDRGSPYRKQRDGIVFLPSGGSARSGAPLGIEPGFLLVTLAAGSGTSARPVALFVLGFARSGTSALTRVLSLCGATLPAKLLGATAHDPTGYWEPRVATQINGKILRRHGSAGFDPTLRLQEEGAFDAVEKAACIAKMRAFFTTLPAAPLVVVKDPKITALSGMWLEAACQAGFDPVAVIAVRHPDESVKSVTAAARTSPEFGGGLWLKYSLLAERNTRGLPRVFVEYANLMDDWRPRSIWTPAMRAQSRIFSLRVSGTTSTAAR
jgi:hypothetical protein